MRVLNFEEMLSVSGGRGCLRRSKSYGKGSGKGSKKGSCKSSGKDSGKGSGKSCTRVDVPVPIIAAN